MFNIDFNSVSTISGLTNLMDGVDFDSGITSATELVDSTLTDLAGCMPDICNLGGTISGIMSNASSSIGDSIKESVGDAAKQFQSSMGDLTKNMAALVEAVKTAYEDFKVTLNDVISNMVNLGEEFFLAAKGYLSDLVSELNNTITEMQSTITSALDSATSAISNVAKEILNDVKSLVVMKCPIANDAIDSSVATIGLSKLKDICSQDNIADGISSAFGNIGDSISSLNSTVPSKDDISGLLNTKVDSLNKWILENV